jgi:hypothetical protein
MAYSKFTLQSVLENFDLTEVHEKYIGQIQKIEPSPWLLQTLEYSLRVAYVSEKSRSEAIIMPILLELQNINHNSFAIYSGANLDADKKLSLNGECDFVLSKSVQSVEINAPIFCMTEAKDGVIPKSWGQCVAQMLGAKIYNHNHKKNYEIIYGCVTNGDSWQFIKLEEKTVTIYDSVYYLNDLPAILGAFQFVINQYQ